MNSELMLNIFLFVLGTAIGSFLNVLIDRLPNEQKITGRSHCDYCQRQLAWLDLIPIISYLTLSGHCRYCNKKISFIYPVVEFITGVMFILVWNFLPVDNLFFKEIYIGIFSCLIVIFFADAKYRIIPDSVQVVLFILSLFAIGKGITLILFANHVASAFLVAGPILFLFLITKGRGMGFGDVKLAFTIGFLFGLKTGLIVLYIAFIIGAIIGLIFIMLGKKGLKSKIAFGPFLVLGIIIMLLWGNQILKIITSIYGLNNK